MKIFGLHLVIVFVLYGCTTLQPPQYAVSADTNQILKQFRERKAVLTELVPAASYRPRCRGEKPIGDALILTQYVANAFNDELKFADLYDQAQGAKISGSMDKIEFSSISGWWDLAITLRSETGVQISVENRYSFTVNFIVGMAQACTQTAQALGIAIQGLIKKTVSHPQFPSLVIVNQ